MTATATRTRTTQPAPEIRIARAAIAYATARRKVERLPKKFDADRAAQLFDEMELAESRLLEIVSVAGDRVPPADEVRFFNDPV